MSDLIAEIRDSLREAGISPRKIMSQNFLVNSHILERQIDYAAVSENDTVLEIGGGTGVLTERLARKASHVFCIEFDKMLASYLRKKFKSNENVTIIEGDVLKLDLPEVNKIVANLPYHISSPITFKLLETKFEVAILMYQLEFAKRMIALPKTEDYSRLSANLQYQAEVKIVEKISKGNFYPPPKVDSAIVEIKLKVEELPVDPKSYGIITRILFNTKNKLVSTVFYSYFKKSIEKDQRINFKKKMDGALSLAKTRVRELSIEDLVVITDELRNFLKETNNQHLLPEK
ncbi:MAG: 16S rRNA (adenine(1518)-N(6)/adenine(1519)-N(6))-dimethyltransferase RsmA [Candidatus Heimdallarchaeota archaeon]